jgi:hypothetical protein
MKLPPSFAHKNATGPNERQKLIQFVKRRYVGWVNLCLYLWQLSCQPKARIEFELTSGRHPKSGVKTDVYELEASPLNWVLIVLMPDIFRIPARFLLDWFQPYLYLTRSLTLQAGW